MITLVALMLGGVGTLIQPSTASSVAPPSTFRILTETSVAITTESGLALRIE